MTGLMGFGGVLILLVVAVIAFETTPTARARRAAARRHDGSVGWSDSGHHAGPLYGGDGGSDCGPGGGDGGGGGGDGGAC